MAGDALDLTEAARAGLDRLTAREKECLRRWLLPMTAKEIAIDLGISPHAVEKRLKMARAKLGVSTSIKAARLLLADEGYGPLGPDRTDLADTPPPSEHRLTRPLVLGGLIMMFAATLLLALTIAPATTVGEISRTPKPGEIIIAGPTSFEALDANGSGYLDGQEAPRLVLVGGSATYEGKVEGSVTLSGDYVEIRESAELRNRFFEEADTDRDGRVSSREFRRWTAAAQPDSPGPGLGRRER